MTRNIRQIRIEGNVAFVQMTQGYQAVIDAVDAPLVDKWNWTSLISSKPGSFIKKVYAVRKERIGNGKMRTILMHRVINNTQDGFETDHVDGDGLNNRRSNLRDATVAQNRQNRRMRGDNISGAKGVFWSKRRKMWEARIQSNGKTTNLGCYSCVYLAAKAYEKASSELHGDFGRLR